MYDFYCGYCVLAWHRGFILSLEIEVICMGKAANFETNTLFKRREQIEDFCRVKRLDIRLTDVLICSFTANHNSVASGNDLTDSIVSNKDLLNTQLTH